MDTYQESQNVLHVGPGASATEVDAAYHKWQAFWVACEINCMHPDQKALARHEMGRLDKAHRILRGRQLAVPAAQAEWFPTHLSPIPGMVRGTVKPKAMPAAAPVRVMVQEVQKPAVATAGVPPPLPRRATRASYSSQQPTALPNLPRLPQLDTRAAFDWQPELTLAPVPDMGFIESSKKRAAHAYRHMAAAVAVGMCIGFVFAGLIDYLP